MVQNQNKNGPELQNFRFDAIIVLGRSVDAQGRLSKTDINRSGAAAKLCGVIAPYLIPSGGGVFARSNPAFAEAVKIEKYLISLGVDPRHVFTESDSLDTWGNAIHSRELIEGRLSHLGLRRLAVLSSIWHDRPQPIFQHVFGAGYEIQGIGVPEIPTQRDLDGERSGRLIMHQVINSSPSGDVPAIRQSLAQFMPLYAEYDFAEAA